jgi:hypothetical protein
VQRYRTSLVLAASMAAHLHTPPHACIYSRTHVCNAVSLGNPFSEVSSLPTSHFSFPIFKVLTTIDYCKHTIVSTTVKYDGHIPLTSEIKRGCPEMPSRTTEAQNPCGGQGLAVN